MIRWTKHNWPLTLFLPAVVTWHSYTGWFHPWPVGIGLKEFHCKYQQGVGTGYVVNNGENLINLVCERPLIASFVESRQSELNSSHPGKEKMWLISCSNTCGVVEREPAQRLLNTQWTWRVIWLCNPKWSNLQLPFTTNQNHRSDMIISLFINFRFSKFFSTQIHPEISYLYGLCLKSLRFVCKYVIYLLIEGL